MFRTEFYMKVAKRLPMGRSTLENGWQNGVNLTDCYGATLASRVWIAVSISVYFPFAHSILLP
jgi:hypothetical protein